MDDERYSVLFGYQSNFNSCGDEWSKFDTDCLDDAVKFWNEYTEQCDFEKPWYLCIRDNETGEIVGDYYRTGE